MALRFVHITRGYKRITACAEGVVGERNVKPAVRDGTQGQNLVPSTAIGIESFPPALGGQSAVVPPDNVASNFNKVVQRIRSRSPSVPTRGWPGCCDR